LLLAFLVLALTVTVRQSALVFLVLAPFCLAKRFGVGIKKKFVFVFALVLPLASAWARDKWLMTRHLGNGFSNTDYDLVRQAQSETVRRVFLSFFFFFFCTRYGSTHSLCDWPRSLLSSTLLFASLARFGSSDR